MKKTETKEYGGWLQANAPEPDYKRHKGWRGVVWRVADFLDGWFSF